MGDFIVRWTARLAVACYAGRLVREVGALSAARDPGASIATAGRWWWTVGCVLFIIHVAAAFHVEHHWNHADAYDYTARRTAEMTGWNSGVGLYVNEVFLCIWFADALAWWWAPQWHQNRYVYWTVQAVSAFLMFQATAVFGPPFWRPVVAVFLLILWRQSRRVRELRPLS